MIELDGEGLTLDELVLVSLGEGCALHPEARERTVRGREALESILESGEVAYGINTGVGDFQNVVIPREDLLRLQRNLLRSTASGAGEPLDRETVRSMLALRANALCKGLSGVRVEVVETLVQMLNRGVVPLVPSKGSVGSSGDLAPLAHIGLVMMGEGRAYLDGELLPGGEAMGRAGIPVLELKEKEGLALVNGTQLMVAQGALALHRSLTLLKAAQMALAMSLEALMGTDAAFDDRLVSSRPHPGQVKVAANLHSLLEDSGIVCSHRDCPRVQDPYTLRCGPQVLGAVRDSMHRTKETLEVEMNSATDNPLIIDGHGISGGNFHGEPVGMVLDHLALAINELAAYSERRTARLVDGKLSGLPPFLTREEGVDSGMMIPQYLAASLVSENLMLSSPGTAHSLPTSANQEDFNSMGSVASARLGRMVWNAERVVAVELLVAAQALEFRDHSPGRGARAAHRFIREGVDPLAEDRPLGGEVEWIASHLSQLVERVESEVPLD
ncbi:MAG: histidine ammonia-lyase [Methanomassiliicoccales archaeon]